MAIQRAARGSIVGGAVEPLSVGRRAAINFWRRRRRRCDNASAIPASAVAGIQGRWRWGGGGQELLSTYYYSFFLYSSFLYSFCLSSSIPSTTQFPLTMSSLPPVYIVSAARTPTGMFLGYVFLRRGAHFPPLTPPQLPLEPERRPAWLPRHQGYVCSSCSPCAVPLC